MTTKTFDFYADPGHGWVKVRKDYLEKLGIADKISTFSYQRGDYAFLEEDCDMGALLTAVRESGAQPKLREHTTDKRSKIRGYDTYVHTPKAA